MDTFSVPKSSEKYYCKLCDYVTSRKSQYDRHLNTRKHKMETNGNNSSSKSSKPIYECDCGKEYQTRAGIFKHKKKCNVLPNNTSDFDDTFDENINKESIILLIKENTELKKMIIDTQNQVMELLKKGTHNTTNSHNKTFNLNFFLNETCKNAMNIMDFVNNLQLQLGDLEKMEDIGYVNGMSNIIIKNLKDMDVTERPVHCTDAKREVLYVKDEDKWDKETSDKPKIRKAIKHVAHKNARLLQEFKEKHPDCTKSESKHSDTYTKLMVEAMGGKGSNDDEQESKIIKKVSKEITLAEFNE